MVVGTDGQKQRGIAGVGDGDIGIGAEKTDVIWKKGLQGKPDVELPGDIQGRVDPDVPDARSRTTKP